MNFSRLLKTIFLVEFISGLYMAVKELFRKSKTINNIIPKNSAPTIINRHPTEIKSKIKKKTELMVLLEVITIKDEKIAITEKK